MRAALAALLVLSLTAVETRAQAWTDWLVASPGSVTGEMLFSEVVGVMFSGGHYEARTYTTDPGAPWSWNYPIYEIGGITPLPGDQIGFNAASTNRLAFSRPVVDPFLAIMSMGQPGVTVTYTFTDPFTVISEGQGYWGDGEYNTEVGGCGPNGLCALPSTVLQGREFHGMIQFSGTFTELNWTSTAENWHSITVGAHGAAAVVPEPASLLLLATGLLGIGLLSRRRRET